MPNIQEPEPDRKTTELVLLIGCCIAAAIASSAIAVWAMLCW